MSQVALVLHLRRAACALRDARESIATAPDHELAVDLTRAVQHATKLVDDAGKKLRAFQTEHCRQMVGALRDGGAR